MRIKKDVVVVIPVHSANPTAEEIFAFRQCDRVLSAYPVVLLHPEGMNLSKYTEVYPALKSQAIPGCWQASIQAYNRLKSSSFFYKLFADYKHLLTYELDAFVFRDELAMWCEKDYSYIGAPWFEGFGDAVPPYVLKGVGNSGFSLRNIQTCLTMLKRIKTLKRLNRVVVKLSGAKATVETLLQHEPFKSYFKIKDTQYLSRLFFHLSINEDHFWGIWMASTFKDFKLATVAEAIPFSFELNPEMLFEMNGKKLPFGCHAWMKCSPTFWEPYITDPKKESAGPGHRL